MAKNVFLSLLICLLLSFSAIAEEDNEFLKEGIKSYKEGNYLRTVQIMEEVVEDNPGSALAYYYLAMAYVQVGNADDAKEAYDNVIMLSPGSQLSRYAEIGKNLLEIRPEEKLPEAPVLKTKKSKTEFYTENVEKDMEERNLKFLIEKMNRNKTVQPEDYQDFKDFSPDKSSNDMPSKEEIAQAYQTLMKAGINPYQNYSNPGLSPEMMQMSQMGMMNSQNMNMMPLLMMMQPQNGQYGRNNVDPKYMQAILSNMMMPNMMDYGENKKY